MRTRIALALALPLLMTSGCPSAPDPLPDEYERRQHLHLRTLVHENGWHECLTCGERWRYRNWR